MKKVKVKKLKKLPKNMSKQGEEYIVELLEDINSNLKVFTNSLRIKFETSK